MSATSNIIRDILSSASTERVVRSQVLEIARQNLHDSEVVQALVDSLDLIQDFETKRDVLRFLFALQPIRFPNLKTFLDKLIALLNTEKERSFRLELINRLKEGLRDSVEIVPVLLNAAVQPELNDDEAEMLIQSLATLPTVPITALEVLVAQNAKASIVVQTRILRLIKAVPEINDRITQTLITWLRPEVAPEARTEILKILQHGRTLISDINPLLCNFLRTETSVEFRLLCLDIVKKTQPWDAITFVQIASTASVDSSTEVRAVAQALLNDQPNLSQEDEKVVADQYFRETNSKVRRVLWARLKLFLRDEAFRDSIIHTLNETSLINLDDGEFNEVVGTLVPYFRRNVEVKNIFLRLATTLVDASHRRNIVDKILPLIDLDSDLHWLVERFRHEPNAGVKDKLFGKLEPLSVIRFPILVDVYVEELLDPSSEFRIKSVQVLSPAAASYHEKIVSALEEVLLYDSQVDLLRSAVKGYLLVGIEQRFDVLLSIAKNDGFEFSFRKQAIERIKSLPELTDEQSRKLEDALASIPDLIF